MQAGFSKLIVTPWRGVPLAGYFNPRPNQGVLDDLHVRCLLLRQGRVLGGFVTLDVCMLAAEFVEELVQRLKDAGFRHARNLIFSATHTHTAPYTVKLFGCQPDPDYMRMLADRVVEAVLLAQRNLADATLRVGGVEDNPLAFNRRYWMKDGGVTTNPGQGNPDIKGPEGPVDGHIGVLAVEQGGRTVALAANITNHTDTVGADLVSADWPGRMERLVQEALGHDLPVLTLIGCAGNINHFDVNASEDQGYAYRRAWELGRCYAGRVTAALGKLRQLEPGKLAIHQKTFTVPYRRITTAMLAEARAALARASDSGGGGDLTSEGLASGEGAVARFFAEQVLSCHNNHLGRRSFRLVALAVGRHFAVASLPGEPFTEIGLAIRRASRFKATWTVSLAMGACGYIPLRECFARGGYETLPVEGGAAREDTAGRLQAAVTTNLAELLERI